MSTRAGIEIAAQIQVMISFTVSWIWGTESTEQPGPGHNTGAAGQAVTPGPASMETVGQAGGEAETHQVDIVSGVEWRDPFVRITNGIIEEDDINSTVMDDVIEDVTEVIGVSLNPGHGLEAVGVTEVDEVALRAEEQAPPRAHRRRTRGHVPRGWGCRPGSHPCRRCSTAATRRRERGQTYLLDRAIHLIREYTQLNFEEF